MVEKIPDERMDKFVWGDGDIAATRETYIPKNLRSIIDEMPKDDEEAFAYLQKQVKEKKITLGEFRFILQTTSE